VIRRYNNKRLIAMIQDMHLCQMRQGRKGDASSMQQVICHVSSHMNALQALYCIVSVQDLMLNHLILATLDTEKQRLWEPITLRAQIPYRLQNYSSFLNRDAELFSYFRQQYHCRQFLPFHAHHNQLETMSVNLIPTQQHN